MNLPHGLRDNRDRPDRLDACPVSLPDRLPAPRHAGLPPVPHQTSLARDGRKSPEMFFCTVD